MSLIYLEEKEEDHQLIMNEIFEIGVDEVGRGCVFGPVFSASIVLSKKNGLLLKDLGLDDSKKLSSKKREKITPYILDLSKDWGIGQSSVREIDKYGIRYATELSMIRAIDKLKFKPIKLYVDGSLPIRQWDGIQETIIKGDTKFASIAAASIVAKVARDSLMQRLQEKYHNYYIDQNKGYGTKNHFLSLSKFGLSSMHRRTFLKNLNTI